MVQWTPSIQHGICRHSIHTSYFFFFPFFFLTPPPPAALVIWAGAAGAGVASRISTSCPAAWGEAAAGAAGAVGGFVFCILRMRVRLRASKRLRKTEELVLNLRHWGRRAGCAIGRQGV